MSFIRSAVRTGGKRRFLYAFWNIVSAQVSFQAIGWRCQSRVPAPHVIHVCLKGNHLAFFYFRRSTQSCHLRRGGLTDTRPSARASATTAGKSEASNQRAASGHPPAESLTGFHPFILRPPVLLLWMEYDPRLLPYFELCVDRQCCQRFDNRDVAGEPRRASGASSPSGS